jgi:hypothetical protein
VPTSTSAPLFQHKDSAVLVIKIDWPGAQSRIVIL